MECAAGGVGQRRSTRGARAIGWCALAVGLTSTIRTMCVCDEGHCRLLVERGNVLLQLTTESLVEIDRSVTWSDLAGEAEPGDEAWDANPLDASGVYPRPFAFDWYWPVLHRSNISRVGVWWTLALPIWLPLAIAVAWRPLWACLGWVDGRLRRVRQRERLRRRLVRASLAASALALGAWIASGFWWVGWRVGDVLLEASQGALVVTFAEDEFNPYLREPGEADWFRMEFSLAEALPHTGESMLTGVGYWTEWVLPLWMPAAAVALPALLLRRQYPFGHCGRCGYDLTGNVSGRCPECGSAVA